MSDSHEVASLDATALADLVRRREVQPLELITAAIERIEELNPALNAVVTRMYDQARIAANGRLPDGPFTGVPFLLKDVLAAYRGVPLTSGASLLRQFTPDHDSELVVRLKRSGLIVLGKTNTPEFGLAPTTEPVAFGPTRNPWHLQRTTGGSSGGSAAAVAAGMVPMAHANDGGGSIRIPASCCGVFGLKPTRARNPLGPDFGDLVSGLVAEHAVTRTVRDSAALLDATAGPDVGDPYWAPPRTSPFLRALDVPRRRLRIAYTTAAPNGVPVHADCVQAAEEAAALCAELGHEVSQRAPELDGELVAEAFDVLWGAGCAAALGSIEARLGSSVERTQVEPLTWALAERGRGFSAADYLLAVRYLQQVSRQLAGFFLDCDVWLTPTLADPPLPLGTFDSTPEDPLAGYHRAHAFVPFTPLANVSGQPAMSMPLHWNAEGLPIGTHFTGRFGDEATLFALAAELEQARPWANRRPSLVS
jgi:amidase